MSEIRVRKCPQISVQIRVPGDKSISHRAVIFSSLARGVTEITGFLPSEDCLSTMKAMKCMGVGIEELPHPDDFFGPTRLRVNGVRMNLSEPTREIDCGNSGTTMRLLCGVLAGQPFESVLTGDESLSKRPMKRVMNPLSDMGASLISDKGDGCAPIRIKGGDVHPIHYLLPVASAQVKSAILLCGLFAEGKTIVTEPVKTRDHTERMLQHFGIKLLREENDITIYGGQVPEAQDFYVPGDISSAAFWVVAAAAQEGSLLRVKGVGLNDTRTGILKVLLRMGAQIKDRIESAASGEPWGDLEVRGARLHGTIIGGAEIPNVIDELPVIAVAGALAEGRTVIRDAAELRVKESDRIAAVASNLKAMGAVVNETPDGMEIEGGHRLRGCHIESYGDHRIAMAFAIAGLFADGETVIKNVSCVDTSYPGFAEEIKRWQQIKTHSLTLD